MVGAKYNCDGSLAGLVVDVLPPEVVLLPQPAAINPSDAANSSGNPE
jgi:hypothetical protein